MHKVDRVHAGATQLVREGDDVSQLMEVPVVDHRVDADADTVVGEHPDHIDCSRQYLTFILASMEVKDKSENLRCFFLI